MSVVRMKPFYIIGTLNEQVEILKNLQYLNCVEIKTSANKTELDEEIDSNIYYKKLIKVKTSLTILKKYIKVKDSFLKIKRTKSIKILDQVFLNSSFLENKVDHIANLNEKIEHNLKLISNIELKLTALKLYSNFDFYSNSFDTRFTKCFVGTINFKLNEKKLNNILGKNIYWEIIDKHKGRSTIFFIVLNEHYEKIKKILLKLKFSTFSFNFKNSSVINQISKLVDEIKFLENENLKFKNELKDQAPNLFDLKLFHDFLMLKTEQEKHLSLFKKTKHTFTFSGYLNPLKELEFKKMASKFNLFYKISSPDSCDPVDFKNGKFIETVEPITKTYSMPGQNDCDPNFSMAFFYYIFFGIMFSDAGYGLIMAIFCSFIAFNKHVDCENRKKFKMFFYCGISTVFWGLMFGSFFGDFIGVFSKLFLKINFVLLPIAFDPLKKPMLMLGFSLILGILQIFVGILLSLVKSIKLKNFKEAFFDKTGWLFLIFGTGLFLISNFLNLSLFKTMGIGAVLIGSLIVLLLSGYKSRGLMKLISGVINLYGATSYVGDVLSYCRLMALSIATGVVASVVNLLSSMLCGNLLGYLMFLIVFIFGHTINFAINALGAYVHTVRLQYVEFFSKFYEGGGEAFKPFGMNTEFFEFK